MNVFTFSGNLGNDCRTNNVGGSFVANFSVAVTSGFGDKKETTWVDCAYWGKGGEAVSAYLKKGQKVVVSGEASLKPASDKYQAGIAVRVNSLTLVGSRSDGDAAAPAPAYQAPAPAPTPAAPLEEDDIPF